MKGAGVRGEQPLDEGGGLRVVVARAVSGFGKFPERDHASASLLKGQRLLKGCVADREHAGQHQRTVGFTGYAETCVCIWTEACA